MITGSSAFGILLLSKGRKPMKIYTKTGDKGTTAMLSGIRIRKSDDRIELIGTIDELNSHLGLVKTAAPENWKEQVEEIQRTLMTIMSGISDPRNRAYKITAKQVEKLEEEIDKTEQLFPRKNEFVLYGGCELSARLDVARAVARRADRIFTKVKNIHGVHPMSMEYINRLADYLYIQARYADYLAENHEKFQKEHSCKCGKHGQEQGEEGKNHKCSGEECGYGRKKDEKKLHQCSGKKIEESHRDVKPEIEISEEDISGLVRQLLKEYQ